MYYMEESRQVKLRFDVLGDVVEEHPFAVELQEPLVWDSTIAKNISSVPAIREQEGSPRSAASQLTDGWSLPDVQLI